MTISYLKGDATRPTVDGNKIIAHICNDRGGWGRGFVLAISRRWPLPEQDYREWHRRGPAEGFELGAVRLVEVDGDLWVANMIAQAGTRPSAEGPPIRYPALREALASLAVEARTLEATVHMPRIGCGLAGGSWDRVEPLIEETLVSAGIAVFVYDFG